MSWLSVLSTTYDNLVNSPSLLKSCSMPLAPPGHTVQTAHAEVVIDENGNFLRARALNKSEALTILPCTASSSTRSSNDCPHLLYDTLDYLSYKVGKDNRHNKYIQQLKKWCETENCPKEVLSIYKYIIGETLFSDLSEKSKLITFKIEKDGSTAPKFQGKPDNKQNDITKVFIRFCIQKSEDTATGCNENKPLQQACTEYFLNSFPNKGYCYATGEYGSVIGNQQHPAGAIDYGSRSKLISGNDDKNFTYRGRFAKPEEALQIGAEASYKAHSALRWLIANQGFPRVSDKEDKSAHKIVIWASDNDVAFNISDPDCGYFEDEDENRFTTLDSYANNVRRALYGGKLGDLKQSLKNNTVMIMIINEIKKGKGRASITYFREMSKSEYIDNIYYWHTTCFWNHRFPAVIREKDPETGKEIKKPYTRRFTGTPTIYDIVETVYGSESDEKLQKHLRELLLITVAENRPFPYEIMMSAVNRASNYEALFSEAKAQTKSDFQAELITGKALTVACAIIRKFYHDKYKEEYDMAVDKACRDRSYLFGRVLAFMEKIEINALYDKGAEPRVPNARRLRNVYRMQPAKTLNVLDEKLEPYVQQLYPKNWHYTQMQSVIALIGELGYLTDKPLDPTFLIGYAAQYEELNSGSKKSDEETNEATNNTEEDN